MKRFCLKVLIYYLPLMLLCYLGSQATGDIGRLTGTRFGYYDPIEFPNDTYSHSYTSLHRLDTCCIVMLGDSYTVGGGNAWHQYFLEKSLQQETRTVGTRKHLYPPFQLAYQILETNALDSGSCLIIETAERHLVERVNQYKNDSAFTLYHRKMDYEKRDKQTVSFNPCQKRVELSGIVNYCRFHFLCKSPPFITLSTSIPIFTHNKYSHQLFIYDLEMDFLNHDSGEALKARDNLLQLKQEADEKGIFLIVMTAANRYNLYYDYIVDNPYPKDYTMDFFADMDTSWFLNTTQLLKPYVDRGEKDIVLLNDTHWSLKAAKIVGEKLADMIRNHQENRQE